MLKTKILELWPTTGFTYHFSSKQFIGIYAVKKTKNCLFVNSTCDVQYLVVIKYKRKAKVSAKDGVL